MLRTCTNLCSTSSLSALDIGHVSCCRGFGAFRPPCWLPQRHAKRTARALTPGRVQAVKAEIKEPEVALNQDSHDQNGSKAPLDHRGRPAESTSISKGSSAAKADGSDDGPGFSKVAGVAGLVLGLGLLLGAGYLFKGQIRGFVDYFIEVVDQWGPLGMLAYGVVYTLLEILALPAIPLTMTAGVIFGVVPGTIIVSISAVVAATVSFLIARYAARDKILELAEGNPKFAAIDKAIKKQGFKVVVLLRLSPLLPLALSNYLYGLTAVDLTSYVLGSWLGMLPGTIVYVLAGDYGRSVIDSGEGGLAVAPWQVALGLGVTILALGYIGKVANKALEDVEAEEEAAK